MTTRVKGKVFKAGNSAAVRLPKDVAFALGTEITIERQGDTVTIRATQDEAAIRRDLERLANDLHAIWGDMPDRVIERRQQPIQRDRPGLM